MTKDRNRFFSFLLVVALLLTLFSGLTPSKAMAQETPEETEESSGSEGTVITHDGFEPMYAGSLTTTDCQWRGRVECTTLDIMTFPYASGENALNSVQATLKKGNKVIVKQQVVNSNSSITYWYYVETLISDTLVKGYVKMLDASSNPNVVSCYTDDCTKLSSYADLTATAAANIYSAPCSDTTDDSSKKGVGFSKGATMVATQLVKNLSGNYWYYVTYTSGGTTYNGYVYAGNVSATPRYDGVSVTSVTLYPSGNMDLGESLTLNGTVKSTAMVITKVGCFVYAGTATSGTAETGKWDEVSVKSYTIKGSNADNNCKIGSLGKGQHTYVIKAEVENNWATSGTAISSGTKTLTLFTNTFSVATQPQYYTVSYDANGGSNPPANQSKKGNVSLKLSTSIPSRSNGSASSYVVTLNPNGGTCDISSLKAARTISYTFSTWNTKADGSGTNYASGSTYTENANVTLYAQWNSNTTTASVQLPTPTRSGYEFMGWATSSSASSGTTGTYKPTKTITLYATWKATGSITKQPVSRSFEVGKTATFSIGVSGDVSGYQWQVSKDGGSTWSNVKATYPSSLTKDLTFTAKASMNGLKYRCVVTLTNGVVLTSQTATLTVVSNLPVITSQPSNAKAEVGKTITMSVTASNATSYQWYYSKNGGESWTKWRGRTEASFTVAASTTNNGCLYRCKVTNASGSVYSDYGKLTVLGMDAPVITSEPTSQVTTLGTKVTFKVTASNATSYQWYYSKNNGVSWTKWSGYTSASFTVAGSKTNNQCLYYCVVKNSYGSTSSQVVALGVADAPPRLVSGPKDQTVAVGDQVKFTVEAVGFDVTYQWQVFKSDGAWHNCKSNGYNTDTFSFTSAAKYDNYKYRCIISNEYGSIITSAATFQVK